MKRKWEKERKNKEGQEPVGIRLTATSVAFSLHHRSQSLFGVCLGENVYNGLNLTTLAPLLILPSPFFPLLRRIKSLRETFCYPVPLKNWFSLLKLILEGVAHFMMWTPCLIFLSGRLYTKHCQYPLGGCQHLAVSPYHLPPLCLSLVHGASVGAAFIRGHWGKATDYIPRSSAGSRGGDGGGHFRSLCFVWCKGNRSFPLEMHFQRVCSKSLALS